jgi:lipopolysaccharide export system protein LptA
MPIRTAMLVLAAAAIAALMPLSRGDAQQAPAKPAPAKTAAAKPAAPAPAPAPATPGPAGAALQSNLPINITADSGIEWQQDQQVYIARGKAVATRGPGELDADTIIAHYRDMKGGTAQANAGQNNTEIYRIEADGNVTIKRDNQTVVGDRADYDVDQALGIVRGKALKMTTTNDVVTARDVFEWYDTKQIMVARGDAVAVHNGRTIKADVLTAYMVKTDQAPANGAPPAPKPAPAKPAGTPNAASGEESKLNRLDAQGHVVVIDGPDIGRGDYGVYNAATGICTLLGNVTITRDKDVVTGQYAVMDLNKNVSRVMPASSVSGATRQRVQGLFVRQEQKPGDAAPGSGGAAPPAKP